MKKNILTLLVLLIPGLLMAQDEATPDFILFLGRFHPAILHLPIGMLVLTFFLEVANRIPRFSGMDKAIELSLVLSAALSVLTLTLGFFLSWEGGYGEELLELHRNLGIAVTVCCLLLVFMKLNLTKNQYMTKLYPGTFLLTMLLLTGTGHFGGSLTHGEDYLSYYLNREETPETKIANLEDAVVFRDLIRPVIDKKCVSCHNTSKTKGDLQLHTVEAIQKGGKNGTILASGNPAESHIFQRVTLPIEDEEHMPPDGKEPLTQMEKAFLEWWIKSGASFDDSVKNLPKTEDVEALLDEFARSLTRDVNPVYKASVDEVDPEVIAELSTKGITVSRISEHNNFVSVRFWKLPENPANELNPIREQLVWLDLSRTGINDEQFSGFAGFENLIRLHLDNNAIGDQSLETIASFTNLEYLNLYGTSVTNNGLANLVGLERLKSLYLWETEVTEEALEPLQSANEDLLIEMGMSQSDLDTIRLSTPTAKFERSMFPETTTVELSLAFDDVEIYYTLDGSDPSKSSTRYTEPIVIDKSCEMRAIATKEGWADSEVIMVDFIKVTTMPSSIKLVNQPSERYSGNGPGTLIDGLKGSAAFGDGKWLGFHQVNYTATVDMGKAMTINRVRLSFLEDIGAYIFQPKKVQVQVSKDGTNFRTTSTELIPVPTKSRAGKIYTYKMEINAESVRYIRVMATSMGTCPDWHPGAGDKAWIFTDEIVVE